MKIAYAIVFIIFVVLACGCTATAPEAATNANQAGIPDLTGTWTGSMQGYNENNGFTDYGNLPMSMVVTGQEGRIFAGHLLFKWNGTESATPMTGVIGRDGRTFSMVEKNNGYTTGEIISYDTIELTWMDDGASFGAALDTLKRV